MKHHSLFCITDLVKSKKLFLKFFSLFLAVLMCFTVYGAALPAYAATSYTPVVITIDMLEAMYESGDLTFGCILSNTSDSSRGITLWNIVSQTTNTLPQGEVRTFDTSRFDRVSNNEALIWCPYNVYLLSGQACRVTYSLAMPFEYYGGADSEVTITSFHPATGVTVNGSLSIYDSNDNLINSFSQNILNSSNLPQSSPIYAIVASLDSQYEFTALYPFQTFNFIMNSNDTMINSIAFATSIDSKSLTSGNNDTILGITIQSFTVYVPGTPVDPDDPDSPSYADVVQDYLSAIVDIDNQTQYDIDVLKAKLNAVDLDLNDISDQLVVQKPDISNGVSSIDTDLLNGSQMFVTQSMTPILNQGIIVILFTGIFAIVSLKLVLFGSGKS